MPEQQPGKSFLSLLSQSGIVEADHLKSVLSQLAKQSGGKKVKLDQLTQHLVSQGLITKWHCEKLLVGKYKGFFLGKYKLLGHLGTGVMSSVYLAEHTIFKQRRAIKVLPKKRIADKTYLDRFYREGRAAASLNHPNIVRVYDIDHEGDTHYLVMEYVEGIDLYETVKQQGPLGFELSLDYMIQAARGLAHAHDNKLVHRDIKPANLLVTKKSVVKLLDLGLALFREEDNSLTVVHNEKVLGTADYLAPEQAINSHDVDHRADIYSFGCTLYYLLTGEPPFPEGTLAQRIAMHQRSEPKPLTEKRADCPPEIQLVVERMMKKDPNDRYQNCGTVVNILQRCLAAVKKRNANQVAGITQQKVARQGTQQDSAANGTTPNGAASKQASAIPSGSKLRSAVPGSSGSSPSRSAASRAQAQVQ